METMKDSVSYSIGYDIGANLKQQEIQIEPEVFLSGIKDGLADTCNLTTEELQNVMQKFQAEMVLKQQNKQKESGEKNKVAADAFFAENKSKEGVISLPSGLQYKVMKSGTGESPKLTSKVQAHYAGRLLDGTEFDNSYKRGQPLEIGVSGVIKGWTEILQLMKVGDKFEVYIPSELGYGERGSGPTIGPNAALIFEIELMGIVQ
ncbi:MAG: FKBP-type peptidyl-prolyl cis-trans isomerase [Ignavibacteriae bacterium]|nr:FKBP-type peptidyl-prolyl cis-trans isomerase [Ignavibacteriota bacterium]